MVTSVNTNINAMAAIQSLNMISNQMTSTQSAIESGLSINTAADNPAVFTIAQGLRANISALGAVSANLNTAVATVQAQTQGAQSISDALTTLLHTVTQGQGQTGAALAATNATITNALSNIDAFANASTINGTNLLATPSSFSVVSNVDGSTTNVQTTTASTAAGLGLTGLQITTGGTTLALSGIKAGDSVTFTDTQGNQTTFEFNDGTAALNTAPANGTAATASDVTAGAAKGENITLGQTTGAINVVAVNIGPTGATTTDAQDMGNLLAAMQANGVAASIDSSGTITVDAGASSTIATPAQVTAGAVAGSYVVNNLTATMATGTAATTAVPGGTSAIDAVNNAIAKIGATLSQLGATTIQLQGLEDFTTQLSDSVTTGLGAMVDANLSAESAQLSSLQTKQSLAIQSLTLANQGPSSLLQLFR
jgi:flagellin